jgi:hypothetical protein
MIFPPSRAIAFHEASHAAALLLAGMPPTAVRVDRPDETTAGQVTLDWGDGIDPDKAEAVLVAILLGGMEEGFAGWRDWPVDPQRLPVGARRDAEQAARLAAYLRLDEAGWLHAVWKAHRLGRRPDFRALAVAIANELERVEVLDADDLRRIHEATREEGELCST